MLKLTENAASLKARSQRIGIRQVDELTRFAFQLYGLAERIRTMPLPPDLEKEMRQYPEEIAEALRDVGTPIYDFLMNLNTELGRRSGQSRRNRGRALTLPECPGAPGAAPAAPAAPAAQSA